MYLSTRPRTLLPHEMNQIERVFNDILRERGLTRQCRAAEAIAKRLMQLYLSGVRGRVALRYLTYLDEPVATRPWPDTSPLVEEVTMVDVSRKEGAQISPEDLELLQRTFDRVCIWCDIPRYGKRADRLARHITDQFRKGLCGEDELFETAMWLERNSGPSRSRSDA
ncbi:hypothetical protein ACIQUG_33745 [Ensifer sp. NPDC090286]|uniref:hypothetical protein n=1 Tax=unclassified Ensifer TaxID=2633371 RepID=UPI00068A9439|nr:hypothetical protein [Ensifer sp. ZNC0028]